MATAPPTHEGMAHVKRIMSIVTTVVVAAAVGLTGSAASAHDRRETPRHSRPIYLALGDSLAAGQQSAPPTGDLGTTLALWKASGFVAQFHDTLQEELDCRPGGERRHHRGCSRLELVNLSRTGVPGVPGSGVTTASMLTDGDQLDQAVALLEDRNGDRSPRNDVEVVSLTVGGNDLFAPAFAACVAPAGPATPPCAPTLESVFAGVAVRYAQILSALRAAGGDDLVILTTTYFNPLPFCVPGTAALGVAGATAVGDAILEGGALPGLGTLPAGFNDVIRGISAQHGAVAVDTFGTLGDGDFVGGGDCLHPDAEGHAAIADVFAAAFPG